MSPSPVERFSALLARSGERGWTPADRDTLAHQDRDLGDALDDALGDHDVLDDVDDDLNVGADDRADPARGVRPGLTRTVLLVLAGAVLTAVLVVVLAPSLLQDRDQPLDGAMAAGEQADAAAGEPAEGEPAQGPAGPDTAGAAADPSAGPASSVVVHVVGAVDRPGVCELPPGARVADALEAVGGTRADADVEGVNLARPLVDGEQIRVPRVGEEPADPPPEAADGAAHGTGGGQPAGSDAGGGTIDLNTADAQALETLRGIGPVTAQAILDHREAVGRFDSVDELLDVTGIGDATLAAIRDSVTVG